MTGAVAALGGPSFVEVMSIGNMNTLAGMSPRSFTLSATPTYSGGQSRYAATAADGSGDNAFVWLSNGSPSNWECRATAGTGTVTTGTMGVWENLGTTRAWTKTGALACDFTLEIGRAGLNTALDTAVVTL